jgi:hypothetical protein
MPLTCRHTWVDVSLASTDVRRWMERYGADPARYGETAPAHAAGERDAARPGEHHPREDSAAETVAQPVKVDNDSYVRDYSRCILCYKCVEAAGPRSPDPRSGSGGSCRDGGGAAGSVSAASTAGKMASARAASSSSVSSWTGCGM